MSAFQPSSVSQTRFARGGFGGGSLEDLLGKIVDAGLAGSICVVPFLMGGRHALGQLVLVAFAVTAAVAWLLRACLKFETRWHWSWAEPLLAAVVALLALQLTPLPEAVLAKLAPSVSETLPLWSPGAADSAKLGAWSRISLTPESTRAAMVLFLTYALLFVLTVQRLRAAEDVERILRWCALAAAVMAVFGLVQLVAGNGKFFWFYEHPYTTTNGLAKGSFSNRNHFAHFLALGMGPLIWWLQDALRKQRRRRSRGFERDATGTDLASLAPGLRAVALGVVVFGALLSLSRGGAVAMGLAAVVGAAVCYRAGSLGRRFLLSLGAAGLVVGVALAIFGHARVAGRLDDLSAMSVEALDQSAARRTIWETVLKATPDYLALGAGVGSHREVYPIYLSLPLETEFTHAESVPLQIGLETGIAGLALLLVGIGLSSFWIVGGLRTASSKRLLVCAGAVAASLVASLAHSLVDFVWYVPACAAMVAIFAGCACRIYQLAREEAGDAPRRLILARPAAAIAAVVVVLGGTWMIANRFGPVLAEPHWDRYRIMARAAARRAWFAPGEDEAAAARASSTRNREESRKWSTAVAAPATQTVHEAELAAVKKEIAELREVLRWEPDHARAQLRMAAGYMRYFDLLQENSENAMALSQIRDAALRSRFPSRQALDAWLARAVGDHYRLLDRALAHTLRGLALCPLQGEGYLYLNELAFLRKSQETARAALIDQALRVRPFDGDVLFEAGREAWLLGDYPRGLELWQRSFRTGRRCQRKLVETLAGRVPVGFFLETFQPTDYALGLLHRRCRRGGTPEELDQLGRYWASAAEREAARARGAEAGRLWLDAARVHARLGRHDRAAECGQKALHFCPNDYRARYHLALALVESERFAEAEKHLKWCVQRKPGVAKVGSLLKDVVKKKLDRAAIVDPRVRPAAAFLPRNPTRQDYK